MSNYLPRTQKKRERQERLEHDLRRLIASGASSDKLIAAAEEVRTARIRTIKAYRQHCVVIDSTSRYDAEIAALQAASVDAILAEFEGRASGEASSGRDATRPQAMPPADGTPD
jgi:hypothetical protein